MQLGQIASSINQRNPGELPSKLEANLREYCQAVMLLGGKELPPPIVIEEEEEVPDNPVQKKTEEK